MHNPEHGHMEDPSMTEFEHTDTNKDTEQHKGGIVKKMKGMKKWLTLGTLGVAGLAGTEQQAKALDATLVHTGIQEATGIYRESNRHKETEAERKMREQQQAAQLAMHKEEMAARNRQIDAEITLRQKQVDAMDDADARHNAVNMAQVSTSAGKDVKVTEEVDKTTGKKTFGVKSSPSHETLTSAEKDEFRQMREKKMKELGQQ